MAPLDAWLAGLLDLVAPRECAACGALSPRGFCGDCLDALSPSPRRIIDGIPVIGVARYRDPLDRAIARFKFADRPDLARPLAQLLAPRLAGLDYEAIVPVPLHPARLAERGFNQAALLARALGSRRPCAIRALVRQHATSQQALLGRAARERNVAGAFALRQGARLTGRVLLLDDVVTTGATARACVKALVGAGAEVVAVACIAVADRGGPGPSEDT